MAILTLSFTIGVFNQVLAGDLPETPISRILEYKVSLELSDAQVKKLTLINNNIINKMLQLQAKVQNHEAEIEEAAVNWPDLDNVKIKGIVKEYYQYRAELKILEFESMAQAGEILSAGQIGKFNETAALELLMHRNDSELKAAN